MNVRRRQILAGLGGLAVAGSPLRAFARTSVTVGAYECLSVSDGHLVLPGSYTFAGLPEDDLAQVLAAYDVSPNEQQEPPCNLTLLRHAERTVLFDAGSGPAFMPSAGKLADGLAALEVTPDEITDVVFTHGHPDHLWGVLDDFEDLVFANAEYWMSQAEWDYWRDPNTVDTIGQARASFAVGAGRRLAAIEDRCSLFEDGQEILPGLMAQASFGHTPGHMSFELRAGTDALLIGGDAISNPHIAFARPDWPAAADQDPELAGTTRLALLDKLAHEQMLLIGFHLPQGGIGRVERAGDAYRFVAEAP